MIRWLPVLGLALLAFEQLFDPSVERVRQARRRWRETARTLTAADQRAVNTAVRHGVAVADPHLADAAVDMAAAFARRPRTLLRWISDGTFALWLVTPMAVYGFHHRWVLMARVMVAPLLFGTIAVLGARFAARAERALAANRAIPRPRPPAVATPPVPRETPSRPWPTWTCPHCDRLNVHPDDVERRYCRWCDHLCDEVPAGRT